MRKPIPGVVVLVALFATVPAAPAEAAFPGANGTIAFTRYLTVDGQTSSDIYTIEPDGTGLTQLTTGGGSRDPAWSRDGRKIAFVRGPAGAEEIYVMNADGSAQTRLTTNSVFDLDPSWSPDGREIAFTRFVAKPGGGDSEIFKMNADGSGLVRLTTQPTYDRHPDWAPDGSKIAFDSGGPSISLMNPDGSGATQIDPNSSGPEWSSDSKHIAFTRLVDVDPGGNAYYDLMTMNRDGTDQTVLFGISSGYAWSPDKTVFVVGSGTCLHCLPVGPLYLINSDGTGDSTLTKPIYDDTTHTYSLDTEPDWQARALQPPYARPASGTPMRVPLVPAFAQCTAPNSAHVAPLNLPACDPPGSESNSGSPAHELTMSSDGSGEGFVSLKVEPGNPATVADEADVRVTASASDVHTKPGGDYAGYVILSVTMRITDRGSGFGGVPGTVKDFAFQTPVSCSTSGTTGAGGVCSIDTTLDSLVPGFAREGELAVISLPQAVLLDTGADGDVGQFNPGVCPPTCASGDEGVFLREGVFTP
jgi:Tol biopolymer transport system component